MNKLTHSDQYGKGRYLWHKRSVFHTFQKNATPSLRDINMHVKEGQLVAVVGSVGSGKSSLISALLGEMKTLRWAFKNYFRM